MRGESVRDGSAYELLRTIHTADHLMVNTSSLKREKVHVWYAVSFCRELKLMSLLSKVVLSDDLWWRKVMQWMIRICWDGTKERVIGTIADLSETWFISLYTPSQERFELLLGEVGVGEAPPAGRSKRRLWSLHELRSLGWIGMMLTTIVQSPT